MNKIYFKFKLSTAIDDKEISALLYHLFNNKELLAQFSQTEIQQIYLEHIELINDNPKLGSFIVTARTEYMLLELRGGLSHYISSEEKQSFFDCLFEIKYAFLTLQPKDILYILMHCSQCIDKESRKKLLWQFDRFSPHARSAAQAEYTQNGQKLPTGITPISSAPINTTTGKKSKSLIDAPDGEYKMHRLLGQGTFGKVKSGTALRNEEKVAVKIFIYNSENLETQLSAQDASYNLRKLGLLKDELILINRGKDKNLTKHYIFMDYVSGQNLNSILFNPQNRQHTTISLSRKIRLTRSFFKALKKFHDKNIILVDVKSKNALVDEDDNVNLIDFDFLKFGNIPHYNIPTTTNGYIAPEVWKNQDAISKASDMYAAGVVISDINTDANYIEIEGNNNQLKHMQDYIDKNTTVGTCEDDLKTLCLDATTNEVLNRPDIDTVIDRLNIITQKHYLTMIAAFEIAKNHNTRLAFIFDQIKIIDQLLNSTASNYFDALSTLTTIIEFAQLEINSENTARLCREATTLNNITTSGEALAKYFYTEHEGMYTAAMASLETKYRDNTKDIEGLGEFLENLYTATQDYRANLNSNDKDYRKKLHVLNEIAQRACQPTQPYDPAFWNSFYELADEIDELKFSLPQKQNLSKAIRELRYNLAIFFLKNANGLIPDCINNLKSELDPISDRYHQELQKLITIADETPTDISKRNLEQCMLYQGFAVNLTISSADDSAGNHAHLSKEMMYINYNILVSLLNILTNKDASALKHANIRISDKIQEAFRHQTSNKPPIALIDAAMSTLAVINFPNDFNIECYQSSMREINDDSNIPEFYRKDLIQEMQKINTANIKIISEYEEAMKKLAASKHKLASAIHDQIKTIMIKYGKNINQSEDHFFRKHIFPSADLILFTKIANETIKITNASANGESVSYAEYAKLANEVGSKFKHFGGTKLAYLMIGLTILSALAFIGASTGGFGIIPAVVALAELGPLICGLAGGGSALVGGLSATNAYKKASNERILAPLFKHIGTEVETNAPPPEEKYGLTQLFSRICS